MNFVDLPLPGVVNDDQTLEHIHNTFVNLSSEGAATRAYTFNSELPMGEKEALILCPTEQLRMLSGIFSRHSLYWILSDVKDQSQIQLLPLRLDSNLLTYDYYENDMIELKEWYKVKDGPLHMTSFGYWNDKDGLKMSFSSKWVRRRNLGGVLLKDGAVEFNINNENRIMRLEKNSNGTFDLLGFFGDVVGILKNRLNFTTIATFAPDGQYGSPSNILPNGTWRGLVGQLQMGLLDMCSAGMTLTTQRETAIDFTMGVVEDKTTLIVGKSSLTSRAPLNVWGFMTIFPIHIWLLTLGVLLVSGAYYTVQGKLFDDEAWHLGFMDGFGLAYVATIQLGYHDELRIFKLMSSKIWFCTVSVFAIIMFAFYTSDLTAFMTSGNPASGLMSFQV